MTLSLSLGLTLGTRAISGTPTPSAPVNLTPPIITGATTAGGLIDLYLGGYDVVPDSYEYQLTNEDGSEVYVDWTEAESGTESGEVPDEATGESLVLHVRATKDSQTSEVTSSESFGPITDALTFIGGVAFLFSGSVPSGYTNLPPTSNATTSDQVYTDGVQVANAAMPSLQLGVSASGLFSNQHAAKTRLINRGSLTANSNTNFVAFEVPSAGTYRIYASLGGATTAVRGLEIWDGVAGSGTLRHSIEPASITNAEMRDVLGVIRSEADHNALSDYGGNYVEVTINSGLIHFRRRTSDHLGLCNFAVIRVN